MRSPPSDRFVHFPAQGTHRTAPYEVFPQDQCRKNLPMFLKEPRPPPHLPQKNKPLGNIWICICILISMRSAYFVSVIFYAAFVNRHSMKTSAVSNHTLTNAHFPTHQITHPAQVKMQTKKEPGSLPQYLRMTLKPKTCQRKSALVQVNITRNRGQILRLHDEDKKPILSKLLTGLTSCTPQKKAGLPPAPELSAAANVRSGETNYAAERLILVPTPPSGGRTTAPQSWAR